MDETGEIPNSSQENGENVIVEVIKRQRAADEVYSWLQDKKSKEDIKNLTDMKAKVVLNGLQDGEIFFIVQPSGKGKGEMDVPIKARLLTVRIGKDGLDREVRGLAPALAVRESVTKEELLREGNEALIEMYRKYEEELPDKLERDASLLKLSIYSDVDIKVPGIGRFPEFVEEK